MNLHSASVASVVWRPHSCISWESCWTSGCHGNEGRWDPWDPWGALGPLGPLEPWDPWDSGIRSRGQIQEPSFEPRHLQSGPVLVLVQLSQKHGTVAQVLSTFSTVGSDSWKSDRDSFFGLGRFDPPDQEPVELWPWSRDQEIKGGEKML